jgi:hypothetical protein
VLQLAAHLEQKEVRQVGLVRALQLLHSPVHQGQHLLGQRRSPLGRLSALLWHAVGARVHGSAGILGMLVGCATWGAT